MSAILKFCQENVRQKLNLRPRVQENPVLHFRYALKAYLKCRTEFSWTHGHHFVFFFHFHNALISQVFVLKTFILEHWNYKKWHQEVEVSELRVFQSKWHQEVELNLSLALFDIILYLLNKSNKVWLLSLNASSAWGDFQDRVFLSTSWYFPITSGRRPRVIG